MFFHYDDGNRRLRRLLCRLHCFHQPIGRSLYPPTKHLPERGLARGHHEDAQGEEHGSHLQGSKVISSVHLELVKGTHRAVATVVCLCVKHQWEYCLLLSLLFL